MKTYDANKIIAEFMGYKHCIEDDAEWWETEEGHDFIASSSLDMLVPVWEKLRRENLCELNMIMGTRREYDCHFGFDTEISGRFLPDEYAPTIQEAAAIATAKAIQELK